MEDEDVTNPDGGGGVGGSGGNCDIAVDGIEAASANAPVAAADSPAIEHEDAPVATALQSDFVYHPKTALAKVSPAGNGCSRWQASKKC